MVARILATLVVLALLATTTAVQAQVQTKPRRVALVIGQDTYANIGSLANSVLAAPPVTRKPPLEHRGAGHNLPCDQNDQTPFRPPPGVALPSAIIVQADRQPSVRSF